MSPPTNVIDHYRSAPDEQPFKKAKVECEVHVPSNQKAEAWRRNLTGTVVLGLPREKWWWTGKIPEECPGFCTEGYVTSLPLPDTTNFTRQGVLDYFENTWTLTEILFSCLQGEEAFYRPPYHELRHPLIFYYAHPAALYVNKMLVAGILDKPVNKYYETIFETGVDEMSWDDISKNDMEWPTIREVNNYRRQVYALVKEIILTHPSLDGPVDFGSPAWSIFMSFEHEHIHLETSSVLMRELPLSAVSKPPAWPPYHPSAHAWKGAAGSSPPRRGVEYVENPFVTVPAGDVTIGKPSKWPSFGWDNEYGEKKMHIREFSASKFVVSNGEFYEFVKSGGYSTPSFWTEDGWKWRTFRNAKWPTFWVPDGPAGLHQYKLRLIFDVITMPWKLPADVNYHEAKAFCKWKAQTEGLPVDSLRILTEGEHHRLRDSENCDSDGRPIKDLVMLKSGCELAALSNMNLAFGSEGAVDAFAPTNMGFHDVFGNVWEWCEDYFAALPGFKVHKYYDDFSTPCFDGQHSVILGGSFVSCGQEASVFARYHFRSHFFQHAGFRVVKSKTLLTTCMDAPPPHAAGWVPRSADPDKQPQAPAVGDSLDMHCLAHYGTAADLYGERTQLSAVLPASSEGGFARRCGALLAMWVNKLNAPKGRALDIGCSVGATCFELSKTFNEVIGVDSSESIIAKADEMRSSGIISYQRKEEGTISTPMTASLPTGVDVKKVEFKQMDACCLNPNMGQFDAVVAANILEHLPSQKAIRLGGALGVVKVGGLALIASTFEWNERITPVELWPGGYKDEAGVAVSSAAGLKEYMTGLGFELLEELDLPVYERETERKICVKLVYTSVWKRII